MAAFEIFRNCFVRLTKSRSDPPSNSRTFTVSTNTMTSPTMFPKQYQQAPAVVGRTPPVLHFNEFSLPASEDSSERNTSSPSSRSSVRFAEQIAQIRETLLEPSSFNNHRTATISRRSLRRRSLYGGSSGSSIKPRRNKSCCEPILEHHRPSTATKKDRFRAARRSDHVRDQFRHSDLRHSCLAQSLHCLRRSENS